MKLERTDYIGFISKIDTMKDCPITTVFCKEIYQDEGEYKKLCKAFVTEGKEGTKENKAYYLFLKNNFPDGFKFDELRMSDLVDYEAYYLPIKNKSTDEAIIDQKWHFLVSQFGIIYFENVYSVHKENNSDPYYKDLMKNAKCIRKKGYFNESLRISSQIIPMQLWLIEASGYNIDDIKEIIESDRYKGSKKCLVKEKLNRIIKEEWDNVETLISQKRIS